MPLLGACTAQGWAPGSTSKEMLPRMGLTLSGTNKILNTTIGTWHFEHWLFFPPQITSFSSGLLETKCPLRSPLAHSRANL